MKVLILFLLFCPFYLLGQERYLSSYPELGFSVEHNIIYYLRYPENYRILGNCNSSLACKNEYPESTLKSILSAKNFDWDQKNYDYTIKNSPEKYKMTVNATQEEFYFELLIKITFQSNGYSFAIIKYHIKEKDRKIAACSVLIENNNEWFIIKPKGSMTKIYMMFNYLSVKSLEGIFRNKAIGNKSFDNQIKQIYSSGILNFNQAINSTSNSSMTKEELKLILDPLIPN